MLNIIPRNAKKIFINTGNILNLQHLKMNATQNATEEVTEGLKNTISNWQQSSQNEHDTVIKICNSETSVLPDDHRSNLKISLKIFLSSLDKTSLNEAVESLLNVLNIEQANSLVLAFPSKHESDDFLKEIKEIWQAFEEYVIKGKVDHIGVSDIDTDLFIALHSWARVKPTIIQINLATCCTVPEPLQEFTKANDIQLLTHSDPVEILPKPVLTEVFGLENISFSWAARYHVHYKNRGVLFSKGYVVSLCQDGHECIG